MNMKAAPAAAAITLAAQQYAALAFAHPPAATCHCHTRIWVDVDDATATCEQL
jgi:hypothetical protein